MKLTSQEIEKSTGVKVKNPQLVTKLALVFEPYKIIMLPNLWREAEAKAIEQMPLLDTDTCFFQKQMTNAREGVWYSFRYYTPAENIISRGHSAMSL